MVPNCTVFICILLFFTLFFTNFIILALSLGYLCQYVWCLFLIVITVNMLKLTADFDLLYCSI